MSKHQIIKGCLIRSFHRNFTLEFLQSLGGYEARVIGKREEQGEGGRWLTEEAMHSEGRYWLQDYKEADGFKKEFRGAPGRLSGWASDFGSSHDLEVPEFKPRIRLCADSSEPGVSFGFCLPLSLSLPDSWVSTLSLSLSLFLSLKNE